MSQPTGRKPGHNASPKGFVSSSPIKPEVPTASLTSPVTSSDAKQIVLETNNKLAEIHAKFKEKHGRAIVIGLDLDGTTASMVGGFRVLMAQKNGITHEEALEQFREPDKYNMWTGEEAWFTTKEDFLTEFQNAEKNGLYRDLPAYEGAKETIDILTAAGFDIKAVTARSADYHEDTAHWITSKEIPVEEIEHSGHTKYQVEGIDIFFDDAPSVISGLVEHSRKVVIFDQPWNENEPVDSTEHTRRVQGWDIKAISSALEELL